MKTTDQTAKHLAARDLLGKRYVQMLQDVPRGDVSAWMVCGCAVAAEAFEQGLSDWADSSYGARARGVSNYDGVPDAYNVPDAYSVRGLETARRERQASRRYG